MELLYGAGFIALCVWITEQLLAQTDATKVVRLITLIIVVLLSFIVYNGYIAVL